EFYCCSFRSGNTYIF
nr:immunoglobulin light chain junction region [Macaca mulatta]MOX12149.1 immunoglobulin light chain junction region [Macaca mulatta]MOX14177.1 immunoglobulin light chain junction region [Macaca mulatta]